MTLSEPPKFMRRFWRSPLGRRVIDFLEPSTWWVATFLVGIVAVNVWALTIQRTQTRDEATHAAEIVANADSQYSQCVASIPLLKKINEFIAGNLIVRDTLVRNARAALRATPRTSRQYPIRRAGLGRLLRARADAYEIDIPVPTIHPTDPPDGRSCDELRARLLTDGSTR